MGRIDARQQKITDEECGEKRDGRQRQVDPENDSRNYSRLLFEHLVVFYRTVYVTDKRSV
jgi:hypothetical protein